MITLKELSKKYGFSEGHFRTLLCRPEFNQFRGNNFYIMDDSYNFHKMLQYILKIKKNGHSDWRLKVALLIFLFNIQTAWCQHYEPVIIYNQYGEPQSMIKRHIIYSPHGQPKKYVNRTMDKK
jgi:hypothetical protein